MIASHRITFNDDQIKEILEETEAILRSGQVVLGERTKEFEQAYAAACGRVYGIAVGSDTAAFEMQLKTLDVEGRHVLYPALAFPSILEAVKNAGAEPWFVDADLTGHLFARLPAIQRAVENCKYHTGEYPRALILMHTGGFVARDSRAITDWCEMRGIAVLEDAAHSFGASMAGEYAGSFGLSSAFSLYATKPMHACEGGIIVTDNPELAEECRIYRNYGRTQDFGRSIIVRHGYSWRMTEIQAVIGLSNLSSIGPNIDRRREIMAHYDSMIESSTFDIWGSGTEGGTVQRVWKDPKMKLNGYRYLLLLPKPLHAEDRLTFKEAVSNRGVDLPGEVYELPSHKQPIWPEYSGLKMSVAEDFCDRHFALPVYQSMTDEDVRTVFEVVSEELEMMT